MKKLRIKSKEYKRKEIRDDRKDKERKENERTVRWESEDKKLIYRNCL